MLPQRWGDRAAAAPGGGRSGALPAGPRSGAGPSLRPSSLLGLAAGTRLALPSPNGGTLCAAAADRGRGGVRRVPAQRLRGGRRGRRAAAGGPIGLVPAGERWPDGTLRVAAEDLIGAGAIAAALPAAARSPRPSSPSPVHARPGPAGWARCWPR